jgi:hypothetical protein
LIKSDGRTIRSEIHKHISSIRNKDFLPEGWKDTIIVSTCICKEGDIVIIVGAYHFCRLRTKLYLKFCCQG